MAEREPEAICEYMCTFHIYSKIYVLSELFSIYFDRKKKEFLFKKPLERILSGPMKLERERDQKYIVLYLYELTTYDLCTYCIYCNIAPS